MERELERTLRASREEDGWEAAVRAHLRRGDEDAALRCLSLHLHADGASDPLRRIFFQLQRRRAGVLGDPRLEGRMPDGIHSAVPLRGGQRWAFLLADGSVRLVDALTEGVLAIWEPGEVGSHRQAWGWPFARGLHQGPDGEVWVLRELLMDDPGPRVKRLPRLARPVLRIDVLDGDRLATRESLVVPLGTGAENLRLSPDGRFLLFFQALDHDDPGNSRTILVSLPPRPWPQAPVGEEAWRVLPEVSGPVSGMRAAFSRDGSRLVVTPRREVPVLASKGTAWRERTYVLDLAGGSVLAEFSHRLRPLEWCWSPCGRWIAGLGERRIYGERAWLELRDAATGAIRWTLPNRPFSIPPRALDSRRLAFSPDGARLEVVHQDGLWIGAAGDGAPIESIPTPFRGPLGGATSAPGTQLFLAEDPREFRLRDVATGVFRRQPLGHRAPITALASCEDGTRLFSRDAGGVVCVWEVASGEEVARHAVGRGTITLSRDGETFLVDRGTGCEVVATDSGATRARIEEGPELYRTAALAPDGAHLLVGYQGGRLRLLGLDGELVWELRVPEGSVERCGFLRGRDEVWSLDGRRRSARTYVTYVGCFEEEVPYWESRLRIRAPADGAVTADWLFLSSQARSAGIRLRPLPGRRALVALHEGRCDLFLPGHPAGFHPFPYPGGEGGEVASFGGLGRPVEGVACASRGGWLVGLSGAGELYRTRVEDSWVGPHETYELPWVPTGVALGEDPDALFVAREQHVRIVRVGDLPRRDP